MAEEDGVRHINIALSQRGYNAMVAWKEAWEQHGGAGMSWGEFLVGMANDRSNHPGKGR